MSTVEELISSRKVNLINLDEVESIDLSKIYRWVELTHLDFELFKKIINKINDLEVVDRNGQKLIEIVTQFSTHDKIQFLIDKGVDLNMTNCHGQKLIHWVCYYNECIDSIKLIMKYFDLNEVDSNGTRTIHYFCLRGFLELIQIYIDKYKNLEISNNTGDFPIHYACQSDNPQVVELLIKNSVNLNIANNKGIRPIHFACGNQKLEIVKLLIENGVNLEVRTNSIEQSDRDYYQQYSLIPNDITNCPEMIKYFTARSALENDNKRPIDYAAKISTPEIVNYLLDFILPIKFEEIEESLEYNFNFNSEEINIIKNRLK